MAAQSSGEQRVLAGVAPSPTDAAAGVMTERILAAFIDLAVLAALFGAMGALFGGVHSTTTASAANPTMHQTNYNVSLTDGPFLLFIVLALAYYFVLEARSGQTLGKRALGLQVVALDDGPLTSRAVFLRTICRLVDVLPLLYLVGLLSSAFGKPRQRLGDRLARTTVARKPSSA